MKNIKNIDFYGNSNVAILEDYNVERWNDLAQRTNTRTFISLHGRNPVNYAEVRSWVCSLSGQNKKAADPTTTLTSPIAPTIEMNQLQA